MKPDYNIKTKKELMTDDKFDYTILFTCINTRAHIKGCLDLAAQLKDVINCRIVFATIGKIQLTSFELSGKEAIEFIEIEPKMEEDVTHDFEFINKANLPAQIIEDHRHKSNLEMAIFFAKLCHTLAEVDSRLYFDDYKRIFSNVEPDLIIVDQIVANPGLVVGNTIPWISFLSINPLSIYESKSKDKAKPLRFVGSKLLTKKERKELKKLNPNEYRAFFNDRWLDDTKRLFDEFPASQSSWNAYAREVGAAYLNPDSICQQSPYGNIYMFPRDIDYIFDDDILTLPKNWINCEPCFKSTETSYEVKRFWDVRIARLRKKPGNSNKQLVYFSLGVLASSDKTLIDRYINCLSKDTKRLYIFNKFPHGRPEIMNIPNGICDNFVPQNHTLNAVDLAIINGDNYSLSQCLYYGVPCIVLPLNSDQFDNAQRLEDLNLGKRLNIFSCTDEELLSSIDTILNDTNLLRRNQLIGKKMRHRDGYREVRKFLVNLLKKNKSKQKDTDSFMGCRKCFCCLRCSPL